MDSASLIRVDAIGVFSRSAAALRTATGSDNGMSISGARSRHRAPLMMLLRGVLQQRGGTYRFDHSLQFKFDKRSVSKGLIDSGLKSLIWSMFFAI